ncbi:MAG: hypothetical protein HY559_01425 [Gammaproteobacteria bacterium]|nr:hypothetical protein [Gammaproteobacteria bacterium]
MQIEEGFRDLKSSQYGFGFEKSRTKHIARIQVLLLIAMLAALFAWLTGWVAEQRGLQYKFQANSIKHKRVLSLFFLGCRVISKRIHFLLGELFEGLINIQLKLSVVCV